MVKVQTIYPNVFLLGYERGMSHRRRIGHLSIVLSTNESVQTNPESAGYRLAMHSA
jgi:hypothetical protein